MKHLYYHLKDGKIISCLHLTDEKALDLLLQGWTLKPVLPRTFG